jgi:hypothetical protein
MAAVVGFTITACSVVDAVAKALAPKKVTVFNIPDAYRSTSATANKYGQLGVVGQGTTWESLAACSDVVRIPTNGQVEFELLENDEGRKAWNSNGVYRLTILIYDENGVHYDAFQNEEVPTSLKYWASTSHLALRQENTPVEWRQFVKKTDAFLKTDDITHSSAAQRSIHINGDVPDKYNGKLAYVYLEDAAGATVAFSLRTILWDTDYPNNKYIGPSYLYDGTPTSPAIPAIFPSSDTGPYRIGLKIYDNNDKYKAKNAMYEGKTSKASLITLTAATATSGMHTLLWSAFTEIVVKPSTTLAEGVWTNGYLADENSEEWFKFTASANTQYIHFLGASLVGIKIQLYDEEDETTIGSPVNIGPYTNYEPLSVTSGTIYRIKVTLYSYHGTYKITYTQGYTTPPMTIPTTGITTLTSSKWADGNIAPSAGEQWFKFTATADSHNIHFDPGVLNDVHVQLYTSDGSEAGGESRLGDSILTVDRTVTTGTEYFIRVTPNLKDGGAYKIAFNTSETPPGITLPPATALTVGNWANGTITAGKEQWFKFTATVSDTQYIHFAPMTLSGVYVMVYKDGLPVKVPKEIPSMDFTAHPYAAFYYISETVTNNQEYYIKVWADDSDPAGTYQLAFNTSATPPVITVPTATATALTTADAWVNGNITTGGAAQWFKFTATAGTQYIHFNPGEAVAAAVQLYTGTGSTVSGAGLLAVPDSYLTRTVTSGTVYYIRVTNYKNFTGSYKIAFSATDIPPPSVALPTTGVTDLTAADAWVNGNIAAAGGEQWFKFTATATTQYIHFKPDTLDDVYVELFAVKSTDTINGIPIGTRANLFSSSLRVSRTVVVGTVYYIKVTPYSKTASGAYKIGFNDSATAPTS